MYIYKIHMCVCVFMCLCVYSFSKMWLSCTVFIMHTSELLFLWFVRRIVEKTDIPSTFTFLASGWGSILFTLSRLFLRTAEMSETWRSWENLQIWNPQYFHISKQELSLKWDLCVHLGENTKISSRWGASIFLTLYRIEVTLYLNELVNPV